MSEAPQADKLDWHRLIEISGEKAASIEPVLDQYFEPFAEPKYADSGERGLLCLNCGEPQTGLLFGQFQWGITHGEGFCSNCHWPARAIHRIYESKDDDEPLVTIRHFPLQYHPDFVTRSDTQ